jgi:hypothetical protein
VGDFFSFDRMLTPTLIQIVFWIGVALSVLIGLVILLSAEGGAALLGLLYIVFGPLVVRVYCELVIVIFRIHTTLVEIRDGGPGRAPAPPATSPGDA